MYAKGMSTGDIETHIQDIYGVSISSSTVSRITDKNLPIAKEQRSAPLFWEAIYAAVDEQPCGCSGYLWGALGQEIPQNLPVLSDGLS